MGGMIKGYKVVSSWHNAGGQDIVPRFSANTEARCGRAAESLLSFYI